MINFYYLFHVLCLPHPQRVDCPDELRVDPTRSKFDRIKEQEVLRTACGVVFFGKNEPKNVEFQPSRVANLRQHRTAHRQI